MTLEKVRQLDCGGQRGDLSDTGADKKIDMKQEENENGEDKKPQLFKTEKKPQQP